MEPEINPSTFESMACAVCGRILGKAPDGYIHPPADQPEDHPCVPVSLDQIESIGRCDFCNVDFPGWVVPARDFEMPTRGLKTSHAHWSRGGWTACDACAALIRDNKWDGLLRRASRLAGERWGVPASLMRAKLDPLYNRIRKNVTGPVRRAERGV